MMARFSEQRIPWSDYAGVQAELSFSCPHMSSYTLFSWILYSFLVDLGSYQLTNDIRNDADTCDNVYDWQV